MLKLSLLCSIYLIELLIILILRYFESVAVQKFKNVLRGLPSITGVIYKNNSGLT